MSIEELVKLIPPPVDRPPIENFDELWDDAETWVGYDLPSDFRESFTALWNWQILSGPILILFVLLHQDGILEDWNTSMRTFRSGRKLRAKMFLSTSIQRGQDC